jgi:hypothetical protein
MSNRTNHFDSTSKSAKINAIVHDKRFLQAATHTVSTYIGRSLLRGEVDGLKSYIQELDYTLFNGNSVNELVHAISRGFHGQLTGAMGELVDTHEMLKQELGTESVDNVHDSSRVMVANAPYSIASEPRSRGRPSGEGFDPRTGAGNPKMTYATPTYAGTSVPHDL